LLNPFSWPDNPEDFFYTNTLIHLLNGMLVICLTRQINRIRYADSNDWFPLLASTIWLLQPILVSTSLMAVQRMTSLSAMLVLIGVISYLKCRQISITRPQLGLTGMIASLAVFTALASLAKENGVLLPGYVLAMELTILNTPDLAQTSPVVRLRQVLIGGVVLATLYLIIKLPSIAASYSGRSFTLPQRLMTEPMVLIEYLRMILFPMRSQLGPFGDDFPVNSSWGNISAISALGALSILITFAYRYRTRFPCYSFAVFWFLVGHTIESTIFPLEIYFEHRNYLPSIGIAIFLAHLPWASRHRLQSMLAIPIGLYCAGIAFVLAQSTSTWGQPMLAAQLWHREHPGSERAALFLAAEYAKRGDVLSALRTTDETVNVRPYDMGLASSALLAACIMNDKPLFDSRLPDVLKRLLTMPQDFAAIDSLEKIMMIRNSSCTWLTAEQMKQLTSGLAQNKRYPPNHFVIARIHAINARLAYEEHDFEQYVSEVESSFNASPQIDTGLDLIHAFTREQLWEAAHEKLLLVESRMPAHPLQKKLWQEKLGPTRSVIAKHLSAL
jgi:hypothetical protein